MSVNTAPDIRSVAVGATRNCAISYVNVLDTSEVLTGTPTVVEVTTTDLTITNKVVNTSTLTIDKQTCTAGQAVQFRVSGQLAAHSPYTIKVTVSSDQSQTFVNWYKFTADAD